MTRYGLVTATMLERKCPTRVNTTKTANGERTNPGKYGEDDASGKMTESNNVRTVNRQMLPGNDVGLWKNSTNDVGHGAYER